jgi:hypothetical protein
MNHTRILTRLVLLLPLAACDRREAARADSLQAAAQEQLQLMGQLAAQKDSLTSIVLDADRFITQVDSQISTVKGLPAYKRREGLESPIEQQLEERKAMLARVNALVERTKVTSRQLAESRQRERALRGEKTQLQEQVDADQRLIAELGATVERQTATIATMQVQIDSLSTASHKLGEEVRSLGLAHYQAYYIVGTERELLDKGVITREGGANLLVARVGRSVTPSRDLRPELFTPIDQREMLDIAMPDSTKRYRIVSRQSLDDARVTERDGADFRGDLHIENPAKFWAPSRFLIIVQR